MVRSEVEGKEELSLLETPKGADHRCMDLGCEANGEDQMLFCRSLLVLSQERVSPEKYVWVGPKMEKRGGL